MFLLTEGFLSRVTLTKGAPGYVELSPFSAGPGKQNTLETVSSTLSLAFFRMFSQYPPVAASSVSQVLGGQRKRVGFFFILVRVMSLWKG